MMAVVIKGLESRRQVRLQNNELNARLSSMEAQFIKYNELQELYGE